MVCLNTRDTDRGYAWVIMVNSTIGAFIVGIFVYSTGVIYAAVREKIDDDHSRASWVGSTLLGAFTLSGPFVGMMINKIGCRVTVVCGGILILLGMIAASFSTTILTLVLSYGLVAGLGNGLVITPVYVIPGHYFEKRRALACSITVSGASLGMFCGAPLARILLYTYGLSGTFLLLGALGAHACIVGMLMRPSPVERRLIKNHKRNPVRKNFRSSTDGCDNEAENLSGLNDAETGKETKTFVEIKRNQKKSGIFSQFLEIFKIFKNLRFVSYIISLLFWFCGESACFVHLPSYVVYKGTSKEDAANLFTAMGATNMFSRLMIGCAGGDPAISRVMLHMASLGIVSILTITFPLYSYSFKMQLFFSTAFGLFNGGPNSLINPLTVDLLGVSKLATGFGLAYFSIGIGFLTGSPIAGAIVDFSGSYDLSYVFAGVLILLASAMAAPLTMLKKQEVLNFDSVQRDREITMTTPMEDEPISDTVCDPMIPLDITDEEQ